MHRKFLIGSAIVAVAGAGVAIAAIDGPAQKVSTQAGTLVERLSSGATIEQFVAQVVGELRSADQTGDGLDRADIDLLVRQQSAQARAGAIAEVLRFDFDADLKVTRTEMQSGVRGQQIYRIQQVASTFERFDANGDGVITIQEAAASAPDQSYRTRRLDGLLALDPDKNGRLTAEELRHLAEDTFTSVDLDRDGKLSPAEFVPIAETVQAARQERATPPCEMPPLPAGAKLVVYSAYEGAAISSVAIGGPDQETNVTDVEIEPGSEPIYLVLTSYESMLWRISGASKRLVHVVVSSHHTGRYRNIADVPSPPTSRQQRRPAGAPSIGGVPSASGVVGLPSSKVTIQRGRCPQYASGDGSSAKAAVATIRRTLGRDPDTVIRAYSTARVALPSGALSKAGPALPPLPRGFDPGMWREASRYWPGGLIAVDPKQVVASVKVEPYKVLPSQMGLSQLIGSGAVERTADGKFRIVRPIAHMPPSMGGAHSVSIILGDGVPMPPGDPVHSCVMSEASWKRLSPGQRCQPTQSIVPLMMN